ncbi:MAG: hypothetical protein MIO93_10410, partial [ANME-2 cluster archaeon]|nr:hypothetical protein [ANME-2 cluster archaeon]
VHDEQNASLCLLEDGLIKYCIQEERLTKRNDYCGFPYNSDNKIFEIFELDVNNIDTVIIASN